MLRKSVLKISSKFTGAHSCRSAISIKLQSNFIEITLRNGCTPVNLLHIFGTWFLMSTSGRLLLNFGPAIIFLCVKKILFSEAVNWPSNLSWRSIENIYNFSKLDSANHSLLLLIFLCPLVFLLLQPVCHMSVICLFLSVTSMPLFCSCLSLVFCQLFICY